MRARRFEPRQLFSFSLPGSFNLGLKLQFLGGVLLRLFTDLFANSAQLGESQLVRGKDFPRRPADSSEFSANLGAFARDD